MFHHSLHHIQFKMPTLPCQLFTSEHTILRRSDRARDVGKYRPFNFNLAVIPFVSSTASCEVLDILQGPTAPSPIDEPALRSWRSQSSRNVAWRLRSSVVAASSPSPASSSSDYMLCLSIGAIFLVNPSTSLLTFHNVLTFPSTP